MKTTESSFSSQSCQVACLSGCWSPACRIFFGFFPASDVDTYEEKNACGKESVLPEGITKEEMIDFIVKNTAYRKGEVINKIESGDREIKDFYLDIVDTIDRKKRNRI